MESIFLIMGRLFFSMCRLCAGGDPVTLVSASLRTRHWVPACAGTTVLFGMLVMSSPTFAMDDHAHHHPMHADHTTHDAHATHAMPSPSTETAYPPPTPEELAAAFPDLGGMDMQEHMGNARYFLLRADRFEAQDADGHTALAWEASASWGDAFNRLWLTSEGERGQGRTRHLDTRLYGSHAFARWWDATLGLRQQGGAGPDRTFLSLGVQGLAPYFFEVGAAVHVGEGGRTALDVELEYEMRLTNRLILQPRLEMNAQGKADPQKGLGRGLTDTALSLRLRYEIRREFAPYAGIEWSRQWGDTADLARAAGEDGREARLLAGVRLWW